MILFKSCFFCRGFIYLIVINLMQRSTKNVYVLNFTCYFLRPLRWLCYFSEHKIRNTGLLPFRYYFQWKNDSEFSWSNVVSAMYNHRYLFVIIGMSQVDAHRGHMHQVPFSATTQHQKQRDAKTSYQSYWSAGSR